MTELLLGTSMIGAGVMGSSMSAIAMQQLDGFSNGLQRGELESTDLEATERIIQANFRLNAVDDIGELAP
jgi:hypothetical protein